MRRAGHALGHVDAQHLFAKAAEARDARTHLRGTLARGDQGEAGAWQRQARLGDARG